MNNEANSNLNRSETMGQSISNKITIRNFNRNCIGGLDHTTENGNTYTISCTFLGGYTLTVRGPNAPAWMARPISPDGLEGDFTDTAPAHSGWGAAVRTANNHNQRWAR